MKGIHRIDDVYHNKSYEKHKHLMEVFFEPPVFDLLYPHTRYHYRHRELSYLCVKKTKVTPRDEYKNFTIKIPEQHKFTTEKGLEGALKKLKEIGLIRHYKTKHEHYVITPLGEREHLKKHLHYLIDSELPKNHKDAIEMCIKIQGVLNTKKEKGKGSISSR